MVDPHGRGNPRNPWALKKSESIWPQARWEAPLDRVVKRQCRGVAKSCHGKIKYHKISTYILYFIYYMYNILYIIYDILYIIHYILHIIYL